MFQEYVPTSAANLVRSHMYMVEMLMSDGCNAEDAVENRHLRTWCIVSPFIYI